MLKTFITSIARNLYFAFCLCCFIASNLITILIKQNGMKATKNSGKVKNADKMKCKKNRFASRPIQVFTYLTSCIGLRDGT